MPTMSRTALLAIHTIHDWTAVKRFAGYARYEMPLSIVSQIDEKQKHATQEMASHM